MRFQEKDSQAWLESEGVDGGNSSTPGRMGVAFQRQLEEAKEDRETGIRQTLSGPIGCLEDGGINEDFKRKNSYAKDNQKGIMKAKLGLVVVMCNMVMLEEIIQRPKE